jgi:hypothetical protein
MELFPNLNKVLVDTYAIQLFNNIDDWKLFKGTVRDLMVSMRSFSSTDNDFYEHERKVSFIYFDILISFILILDRERKVFEKGARQEAYDPWNEPTKANLQITATKVKYHRP